MDYKIGQKVRCIDNPRWNRQAQRGNGWALDLVLTIERIAGVGNDLLVFPGLGGREVYADCIELVESEWDK